MRFLVLSLFTLCLLAACQTEPGAEPPEESETMISFRKDGTLTFTSGDQEVVTIDIEIAETDSARTRGLMQRTSLPEKGGMLFVFDREEPQGFWMANTPLSIDLIFVSADSHIVSIAKYAKPLSQETILSRAPARYVVEVPAGFADTYGLLEGDGLRWQRTE